MMPIPIQQDKILFKKPQRAMIYPVEDAFPFQEIKDEYFVPVECMFNPSEYTISRRNAYEKDPSTQGNVVKGHFVSVGSQTLRLSLTFDSYEEKKDITEKTRLLWRFTEPRKIVKPKQVEKKIPVQVAFEWGSFRFVAYITSLQQKFTLFTHEGVPVRAKVDVDFEQYTDIEDYPPPNPTSGGGAVEQVRKVIAGDRLDIIAAEVYHDATKWRQIAEHNHLRNPLALRPGQVLRIPMD